MEDEELFYNNIQRALDNLPKNVNILEEKIDLNTQMAYFEFSKEVRKKDVAKECFEARDELFEKKVSAERKKEILTAIAGMDDVKAFRTIEKFLQTKNKKLKQWAVLAYQESRMLIQSSLLEEQQVFISTGLGGEGNNLRYFVVFIQKDREEKLSKSQQKLLKNELIYEIEKGEGKFEQIEFIEGFTTANVLLPLQANIKVIFRNVIDECNQYGNFLDEDMIVTNVKVIGRDEIIEMLEHQVEEEDEDEEIDENGFDEEED